MFTPDPGIAHALSAARARYAANPSHAPAGYYPRAGSECLITACGDRFDRCRGYLRVAAGTVDLVRYNAEHSTAHVLTLFDRAIETAEGGRPVPRYLFRHLGGGSNSVGWLHESLAASRAYGNPRCGAACNDGYRSSCASGDRPTAQEEWECLHRNVGGTWRAELVA